MMHPRYSIFPLLLFSIILPALSSSSLPPPIDPSALLDFKSHADIHNRLSFSPPDFCRWDGVVCSNSRVVSIVIENVCLGGVFLSGTLDRLDQLRILSLRNDSLTGRIPDVSGLLNLKAVYLSRNYFFGAVPPSVASLHRLKTLDLSYNMLAGSIPEGLVRLDRLYCLRLEFNRFSGSVPPLNQSGLRILNVSHNLLGGTIPMTPTLSRFGISSFALNFDLCGEIIGRECRSTRPFFDPQPPALTLPPPALSQTAQLRNGGARDKTKESITTHRKHKGAALIVGFSSGASVFVISLICIAFAARRCSRRGEMTKMGPEPSVTGNAEAVMRIAEENEELEAKVKTLQAGQTGRLIFCGGEAPSYALDQLMRASAELLGRGTMGTTYKAVLDTGLIIAVKRLDGAAMGGITREAFEQHMETVGALRHPNLVPLRAYFQAREERILVYDYSRNGSISSLIHGSRSGRSKPLHWTSCLKMAEDVAQGLSYIHHAWRLIHGNLKSSNILLRSDFEACLTDYCLVTLSNSKPPNEDDPNSVAYQAPEIRRCNRHQATSKCDVYSLGIILLELLTGVHPSEHPTLAPGDMINWMGSLREDRAGENRSEMLLKVAMACREAVPEQRPAMGQVTKMIQEIKEVVLREDIEF